ncbi:MAG: hypothetical protein ACI915_000218 [Gammaproteobacteria bacterium]|jgi:hypothetical protein
MPITQIKLATSSDLNEIDILVAAYHQFEAIVLPLETRRLGVKHRLENEHLGRIWLIEFDS